jgi:hypothetical protein
VIYLLRKIPGIRTKSGFEQFYYRFGAFLLPVASILLTVGGVLFPVGTVLFPVARILFPFGANLTQLHKKKSPSASFSSD